MDKEIRESCLTPWGSGCILSRHLTHLQVVQWMCSIEKHANQLSPMKMALWPISNQHFHRWTQFREVWWSHSLDSQSLRDTQILQQALLKLLYYSRMNFKPFALPVELWVHLFLFVRGLCLQLLEACLVKMDICLGTLLSRVRRFGNLSCAYIPEKMPHCIKTFCPGCDHALN